jgi:1-deoxy-D-xylulose-5-phosphate reductoisomerase
VPALDLASRGSLSFAPVDHERFPALGIALAAGRRNDTSAAAVCGADESAVTHFLAGRARFTDIAHLLERALDAHAPTANPSLDNLLAAERWGRNFVDEAVMAGTVGVA